MFYVAVILICFIAVFPFYYAVVTSFKSGTAIFQVSYLPDSFDWGNYKAVFGGRNFIPRKLISSNSPARTAICGNINTARMVSNNNPRPRNRTRASA